MQNLVRKKKKKRGDKKGGAQDADTLIPQSDPTKLARKAYILALGLIAFFTITGHFITTRLTEQQKEAAEISYQIGRQRALAQQIMMHASNYFRMNEALDLNFMQQFLYEFEQGHEYLTRTIQEEAAFGGHKSEALYRIYYKPPFDLNQRSKEYVNVVRDFSKYDPKITDPERIEERRTLANTIAKQADTILRPGLDAAFENFQTEMLEKITRFYSMQLSGVIFILVVLIGEAVFIFRPMISRIKEYNQTMKRLALEDTLTGLNNRRAFMNMAVAELARSKREQTPVTVALLDIDHFKSVNDTYGHEVGDHVLRHFSEILKRSFRISDIIGRIGGEEFAIVLPRIGKEGALTIMQRFREEVANTPCEFTDTNGESVALSYTVSIGFTGPSLIEDVNIDALLAQADLGLYKAKEQGRNCVISED